MNQMYLKYDIDIYALWLACRLRVLSWGCCLVILESEWPWESGARFAVNGGWALLSWVELRWFSRPVQLGVASGGLIDIGRLDSVRAKKAPTTSFRVFSAFLRDLLCFSLHIPAFYLLMSSTAIKPSSARVIGVTISITVEVIMLYVLRNDYAYKYKDNS